MPSEITVRRHYITHEYGYSGNDNDSDGAHSSYVSMHMTIGDAEASGLYKVHVDYITYYTESYALSGGVTERNKDPLCVIFTLCNAAPGSFTEFTPYLSQVISGYTGRYRTSKIPIWYYPTTDTARQPPSTTVLISGYSNPKTYYTSASSTVSSAADSPKNRVIEIARRTYEASGSTITEVGHKGYLVYQSVYKGVGKRNSDGNYYVKDTDKSLYSRIYTTENFDFYISTSNLSSMHVWTNTYAYFGTGDGFYNCWQGWEDAGTFNTWTEHSMTYSDGGYRKSGDSLPATVTGIVHGTSKTVGAKLNNYSDTTSYTVTFDSNGGSSVSSTSFTKTISHTFGGWKAGGTTYNPGDTVTVNSDLNFVAQWSHATSRSAITLPTPTKKVKLYYNSNSHGTLSKSSDDINLTFDGWYTAASGGTKIGNGGASYTPSDDGNKKFYAHWSAGSMEGSSKSFPTVTPSTGYATEKVGSGSSERDLWTTSTNGTTEFTRSRAISSDTTAYIKYKYRVRVHPNGGVITVGSSSYTGDNYYIQWKSHGSSVTLPSDIKYLPTDPVDTSSGTSERSDGDTSVGKTCIGLNTSRTATTASKSLGGTYTDNAPITYYAIYEDVKYTVTFDANGGKFPDNTTTKSVTVSYGGSATPPSSPTRSGYTFTGWSGIYTNVRSNRTIKANWGFSPIWIYKKITSTLNQWVGYHPEEGSSS